MPSPERNLDDIVNTLRAAKDRGRGASLLIGAGCSYSAGIPLAAGFVEEIAGKHGSRLQHLVKKTYPACMGELAPNERQDVIGPHIDKAKINWAHMAIAQLMKEGYVSRILTTNFDPLVVRACAMVGVFPAVYDLAASQTFKADRVHEPAVFYLHGQRAGFVTLHTEEEVARHKTAVAPVFDDAGRGRVWMVCGYSGENDPVFDHLAEVTSFGYNLYWIGFRNADPADHVRTRLLQDGKYAFYVRGYDADSFFVELARRLDCFPPGLIAKPFSHLLKMTDLLAPFTIGQSTVDLREAARTRIRAAIDQFETGDASQPVVGDLQADALDANTLLFSGKYDEVLDLFRKTEDLSEELRDAAAWALIEQGIALAKQARAADSENVDPLWKEAIEKYAAALQIRPDMYVALYNWGTTLAHQAKTKSGEEADVLWNAACEKYAAAVQIKPDDHETLNNWGNALDEQAKTKSGEEAEGLWRAAYEKYAAAVQIEPDDHRVLNNWGVALMVQASNASAERKEDLLSAAVEKCSLANEIVPGEGSYNLACVAGIRGDAEECRKWLLHAKEHGKLPDREHMLADPDLAAVRDEAWFRELVGATEGGPSVE
ncbi:MAG TPA: hypothetical protein VEK57_30735 [Thermoanaerobaculia bacterium]|nr:hypothetical protein [Thermoanaerobaculia bacterium]